MAMDTPLPRNSDLTMEYTALYDGDVVTPDLINVTVYDALGASITLANLPVAGDPSSLVITNTEITDTTSGPLTFEWVWEYGSIAYTDREVYQLEPPRPAALYLTLADVLTRVRSALEEPTAVVWSDASLIAWAYDAACEIAMTMRLPEPQAFAVSTDMVQIPRSEIRSLVAYVLARAFEQVSDDNHAAKYDAEYQKYAAQAYMRYIRNRNAQYASESTREVW